MASQLRVDEIIASTGSSVAIGTAGGSVTLAGDFTVDTSKGLNVGTGATIFSPSSNVLTLGTNNAERVRIDSSGNLSLAADTDTHISHPASDTLALTTGGTERLRITSDGTILMGGQTSSYDGGFVNLELRTDSNTVGGSMTLVNHTSATEGATCEIDCFQNYRSAGKIVFGRENGNNWQASAASAYSFISFHTQAGGTQAEKLRITSGGNLGVGVTNPSSRLDVVGGGIACSGWSNSNSGASGGMELGWDGTQTVLQSIDRNGGGGFQPIFLSGSEIKSSANIRFTTSGNGIDFSADGNAAGMTSELLDDYEQGSWTATAGNNITLHSTTDLCSYIKIGNLVTVFGQIRVNNAQSAADLFINNLPFAVASYGEDSTYPAGAVRLYAATINSGGLYVVCFPTSTNNLIFQSVHNNAVSQNLDATGNGYYMFSCTYRST